ncbi:MAG: anion permease [Deltaproteobacteria bacterium]|nr:anion permease [Deltaproteobacteria bacterium]
MSAESRAPAQEGAAAPRVLVVDDEERFRTSLARRLRLRAMIVSEAAEGAEALRHVRRERPDVVVLDRKMPGLSGEEVLREVKRLAPEVQVIMLTGHGSIASATTTGRLGAFAYLEKPCEMERLLEAIERAREAGSRARVRHEIAPPQRTLGGWLWGTHGLRPIVLVLAALLFAAFYFAPAPAGMLDLLGAQKTGAPGGDPIAGYAHYAKMERGENIASYYGRTAGRAVVERPLVPQEAARALKVMLGTLVVAALCWATGALPVGITALLVGAILYASGVFRPDMVAAAYARDAVLFVAGVLALSAAAAKAGLDRRAGLLLLRVAGSGRGFLFLFCPLLALAASFLPGHALTAFVVPIVMVAYMGAVRASREPRDRSLAVPLVLGVCYACNLGSLGSPAGAGRNALVLGILEGYGPVPGFGRWLLCGLPTVLATALVLASYLWLRLGARLHAGGFNAAAPAHFEAEKLGPLTRQERLTAAVLLGVVALWCAAPQALGLGGPALLGLVALAVLRLIGWRDIGGISWDVVAMYGAACAMAAGLASTGAALWVADGLLRAVPELLRSADGLLLVASGLGALLANLAGDGAAVATIGPVAAAVAKLSGSAPSLACLATAFAASLGNCLIVATPSNAIAYSLAKDLDTGEQLVGAEDFLKHGLVASALGLAVLWGSALLGWWRWVGW